MEVEDYLQVTVMGLVSVFRLTIDITGNATNFGTLTTTWKKVSDATRTVFGGGLSTGGSKYYRLCYNWNYRQLQILET